MISENKPHRRERITSNIINHKNKHALESILGHSHQEIIILLKFYANLWALNWTYWSSGLSRTQLTLLMKVCLESSVTEF